MSIDNLLQLDSVWKPLPVSEEPRTLMSSWSVVKVAPSGIKEGDTVHFVGWAEYEGRVSSAIQSFDKESMCGISKSGRVYQLVGTCGHDRDAEYTFRRWLAIAGMPTYTDITEEYQ